MSGVLRYYGDVAEGLGQRDQSIVWSGATQTVNAFTKECPGPSLDHTDQIVEGGVRNVIKRAVGLMKSVRDVDHYQCSRHNDEIFFYKP